MRQKHRVQQIKNSARKIMSSGVAFILHPKPYNGHPYNMQEVQKWKKEHDQQKMERILLERNMEHFRQAQGTPFTSKRIHENLPFAADRRYTDEILES